MEETICAISTSPGVGAISIIRVSGVNAIKIVNKIFKGKDLEQTLSHTINYGFICDKNEKIDEVLVSVMKAPRTYTTEDVVEINTHGGINTTNKILELLLEHGCILAEPGEFTKRAFLNGRIDLTQAEAVNDLINAKNDNARILALNNMSGKLKELIKEIKNKVVNIMANIEVNIDYPEYNDIEVVTSESLIPNLKEVKYEIEKILNNTRNGRIINEGINIAIVGKPNVGKSSLLNAFLGDNKAIVTDIAGTTRDIIEGTITLNGFLINFIDTAGIRETMDVVEKIGVEKSKEAIKNADIIIVVLNFNEPINKEEQEIIDEIPENKRIIFINKNDLQQKIELKEEFILGNTLSVDGIDKLKEAIINKLNLEEITLNDMTYMSNIRQIDLLKKSLISVDNALKNLERGMPIDIVEIDLTNIFNLLGEITGETYNDDLMNTLFSNFCIGK